MKERCIEKHLYERRYQTATGEWSRVYYIRLKDWKGVRRVWPAGNNLKTARAKRAEYEHRNALKEDFDRDKVQGMTFARWGAIYLERYAKDKRSVEEDPRHVRVLSEFFGNMLLAQVTKATGEEFKQFCKERLTYKGGPEDRLHPYWRLRTRKGRRERGSCRPPSSYGTGEVPLRHFPTWCTHENSACATCLVSP